jgi:hypothetical protein
MAKKVYRVTMALSGRRKYIGVRASTAAKAIEAAKTAECNGYRYYSVAEEPARPVNVEGE